MKKLTAKIIFDILLTIVWIVLMLYSLTGAFWHEAIGLGLLGLFAIHIIYNIPLLSKTVKKMFTKGRGNLTFKYILDIALLISMLLCMISGVLISRHLLTSFQAEDLFLWTWIHDWSAYLTMVIISIHVGLHWKMVLAVIRKPFKSVKENKALSLVGKVVLNLAAIAIMIYGFIAQMNYDFPTVLPNTDESHVSSDIVSPAYAAEETPTLDEYLGNLICTACPKGCSLLSPQCGRASEQIQSAKEDYYATYGNETTTEKGSENNTGDSFDNNTSDNSTDEGNTEKTADNNFIDMLSIMGLYIGGTYYISRIATRRKAH